MRPRVIEGPMLGIGRRRELRRSSPRGSAPASAPRFGIHFLDILAFRRRRGAESRHFDDFVAEMHMRQAKAPADQAAIAKQPPHLFRQRIGRHVEVFRRNAQEQVAHRPADQKSLITRLFEAIKDFQGVRRYRCARYRMLGARDHSGGNWRRRCVQKGGFRLSPKNWPVYYQPSWVQAPKIRKSAPFV